MRDLARLLADAAEVFGLLRGVHAVQPQVVEEVLRQSAARHEALQRVPARGAEWGRHRSCVARTSTVQD